MYQANDLGGVPDDSMLYECITVNPNVHHFVNKDSLNNVIRIKQNKPNLTYPEPSKALILPIKTAGCQQTCQFSQSY